MIQTLFLDISKQTNAKADKTNLYARTGNFTVIENGITRAVDGASI